jgi:hypothetical protein
LCFAQSEPSLGRFVVLFPLSRPAERVCQLTLLVS